MGWSMGETMTSRLVVDALDKALKRRLPEEGLLAHPDRGSRYASAHYQRSLSQHGLGCSMTGVAQCWDNAPAESFFATLKNGLVHHEKYDGREQARAGIFEHVGGFSLLGISSGCMFPGHPYPGSVFLGEVQHAGPFSAGCPPPFATAKPGEPALA